MFKPEKFCKSGNNSTRYATSSATKRGQKPGTKSVPTQAYKRKNRPVNLSNPGEVDGALSSKHLMFHNGIEATTEIVYSETYSEELDLNCRAELLAVQSNLVELVRKYPELMQVSVKKSKARQPEFLDLVSYLYNFYRFTFFQFNSYYLLFCLNSFSAF